MLAASGATADAAATIIANAVDLPDHPAIRREPANSIQPDTDLRDRLVTTNVGELAQGEIAEALAGGVAVAESLMRRNLIHGAALFLAGQARVVGDISTPALKPAAPAPRRMKEILHA